MRIKDFKVCPRKAFWGGTGLQSAKGAKLDYIKIMHDQLRNEGFSGLAYNKVKAVLESIPETQYELKHEREVNIEAYARRFDRMAQFFQNWTLVNVGKPFTVQLENGLFSSSYDFAAKDPDGKPYAVKVAFTKPGYTQKPGTSNFIGEDVELYCLWKETGFQPMVYSFLGKETAAAPVEPIDQDPKKAAKAFVSTFDFEKEPELAEAKLDELQKKSVSKYAEKDETKCDMCFYRNLCHGDDLGMEPLEKVESSSAKSGEFRWTPAQQKVIQARTGEWLVLAGAGSGKTSSLTYRIAEMVREGIDPKSILAVTFTEKGAREMKEKMSRYGVHGTDQVMTTTFNGFGYDLLRKFWNYRYEDIPELIDEAERLRIIAGVIDRKPTMKGFNYMNPFMKFGRSYGVVHEVAGILSKIDEENYSDCITVDQFLDVFGKDYDPVNAQILTDIYNEVNAEEYFMNKIEYADQIHEASHLLKSFEDIRDYYQTTYKHIIIDEFQDTGNDQMEIIQQIYLPGPDRSLLVCGDDSQAIFGFRGVGNENILTFDKWYPNVQVIPMVENWRSTAEIIDVANKVVSRNGSTKELVSDHHGEPVDIVPSRNANEAMDRAFEQVMAWIQDGIPMYDIAVLAKTRAELVYARKLFKDAQVPTVVSVSEYLKDDSQIIAATGLASWMKDPNRTMDLAIWLRHSEPQRFESIFDVEKYVQDNALVLEEELLTSKEDGAMYSNFMETVKAAFENMETNAFKTFLRMEEEAATPSFARVEKFLTNLVKYNSSLSAEVDDTKYNAVTLSTVHAAKGREWDYVVVCPNCLGMPSLETDGAGIINLQYDEEAIRLYFVAITRAKTKLVICANPYWIAALNPMSSCLAYDSLKETNAKVKMSKEYSAAVAKQKRQAKKK